MMTNLPITYANQTKWFPLAPSELMEVSSTACVCKRYPGPGCFSLLLLSLLRSIITFLGCCISLQIHSDNYLCPTQLSVHREGTATPLCKPLSKTFNLIESETHTHSAIVHKDLFNCVSDYNHTVPLFILFQPHKPPCCFWTCSQAPDAAAAC